MRQRLLSILLVAIGASTLLTPFQRDLFVGDETKYGQVLREMRAAHVFFIPILGGTPFTHKPPLHFWLIDLLTFPFGLNSMWAFVLPSLLGLVMLLWAVKRMGDELFPLAGPSAGYLAAFVTATSLMIWGSAQTARMDISFTAFLALAVWMLYRFFRDDDFRALAAAAIAIGIATLIKGPMAPVIAIVLFVIEAVRRRRVPRGNYAPAIGAMIVIPLLWVVPAVWIGGRAFADEILLKQTVGRAVSAWVHKAPPWYYFAHMPGVVFPWFLIAVVVVIGVFRGAGDTGDDDARKFCVSWIAAVLLPYSLMSSKLDVYMMALIPPVGLLIADFVARDRGTGAWRWAKRLNIVMIALLGVAGIIGAVIGQRFVSASAPESALIATPAVRGLFVTLAVASVIGALIASGIALRSKGLMPSTIAVGLVPLAAMVYVATMLMPVVNDLGSTRPLIAALVRQQARPDDTALYACPNLWARDMPEDLGRVRYIDSEAFRHAAYRPAVLATSRAHANEIAYALGDYRKVAELRMIGKWFDVYRRNGH